MTMHRHCHRCGGELAPGDESTTFCPHCGAPQLYLQEYDRAVPADDAPAIAALPSTHPQRIDWQAAIRCGALVSAIAALLSLLGLRLPVFSFLSFCWTVSASMTTLALYQRRRPTASMDTRIGARIGLTTGLLLAVSITVSSTIAGVVARFGLHTMAPMDAQISLLLRQLSDQLSRSAAGNADLPQTLRFVASPEFRAGYLVFTVAMVCSVLLLLSTLGGAVGGLLRTRRRIAS